MWTKYLIAVWVYAKHVYSDLCVCMYFILCSFLLLIKCTSVCITAIQCWFILIVWLISCRLLCYVSHWSMMLIVLLSDVLVRSFVYLDFCGWLLQCVIHFIFLLSCQIGRGSVEQRSRLGWILLNMPYWVKIQVVPWNHGVQIPQGEGLILGSCPGPFKSIGSLCCTGCCKGDYSAANSVMQ